MRPIRVFDSFTTADGKVEYRWLWCLIGSGERRFISDERARALLARLGGGK